MAAPLSSVQSAFLPVKMATRAFSIHAPKFQNTMAEKAPYTGDLSPLKLEGDLYAVVKVHNNPFLVTKGDKMILPFNLRAEVGDVLNFHEVTTIGSRNYTLVDEPIDPGLFTIKAVVLEKTKLPMRVTEKTKRRQRKVKHAISKPHRTILRVTELRLN